MLTNTHHHSAPFANRHTDNTNVHLKHLHTVLSPLDLWTNPVAMAELLAKWSNSMAAEQTMGQSDHLHATGGGR